MRASATIGSVVPCLYASIAATLMLMKRTSGFWNAVRDAVVKSSYRVPIPMIRSASAAMAFAAVVPVEPIAPSENWWSHGRTPTPACVFPTGMPVSSTNLASSSLA